MDPHFVIGRFALARSDGDAARPNYGDLLESVFSFGTFRHSYALTELTEPLLHDLPVSVPSVQLRERKNSFVIPKRHRVKHLDFLIPWFGIQGVGGAKPPAWWSISRFLEFRTKPPRCFFVVLQISPAMSATP